MQFMKKKPLKLNSFNGFFRNLVPGERLELSRCLGGGF